MSELLVLDTGVLGMATNPKVAPTTIECHQWIKAQLQQGKYLVIPEIADYELRRELLRANKIRGLARLDALKTTALYLPITTQTMLKAAEFWAIARKQGKSTADEKALDGDVILAAQTFFLSQKGHHAVIATTNPKHLELFVTAKHWHQIT